MIFAKDIIKPKKLVFKTLSLEWVNHFGLPIFMGMLGLMSLFYGLRQPEPDRFLIGFGMTQLILGSVLYWTQLRRLRFQSFSCYKSRKVFREETRQLLIQNGWDVDYDNQQFLQATLKTGFSQSTLITLRYKKDEVQWNLIRHPLNNNAIALLLPVRKRGHQMIKKIEAQALRLVNEESHREVDRLQESQ